MSKIMVVEDDAPLREIYSIRITAEGYDVVPACDGEEALAIAVREKPDLILSDIMMPKISGFDMLDILRSTPETANIKVVMMTALSAEDQRLRGERLGADRYLVKSQVGIEDVINVIHELLGDGGTQVSSTPNQAPEAQNPMAMSAQFFQNPQPSNAAQASQTSEDTQAPEGAQNFQVTKTAQASEAPQAAEASQAAEAPQAAEVNQFTQTSQAIEATQSNQAPQIAQSVQAPTSEPVLPQPFSQNLQPATLDVRPEDLIAEVGSL